MDTPNLRFASRTKRFKSSIIRDLLALAQKPEVISFAGGLPAPETFPVEAIRAFAEQIMIDEGRQTLQYGPTEGYLPLREAIIDTILEPKGISVSPDDLLITSGSQQGLDLLARLFADADETILLENPTYLGAIQAFDAHGGSYHTMEMDRYGLLPESFAESLTSTQATLGYLLPNFQNPTGITLSEQRRQAVATIVAQHDTLLIEDDPYGDLRFEGEYLPTLKKLVPQQVAYLGTFSKILSPGLRIGYMVAPRAVVKMAALAKQGADLHTEGLAQRIAARYLQSGLLPTHLDAIRENYKQRRDVMVQALTQQHFASSVQYTIPEGGLFFWLTLPEGYSTLELFHYALQENVAFVPGTAFYANGGGQRSMRLNFSAVSPAVIAEGMQRLGRAFDRLYADKSKVMV